ncbi:SDR family NAD(P)-dependent oxidoreductase [Nitratireductor sp. GCM10026969]|uniref:SDR family NAD(P)-dependent oxidoreductase n=1 Tax=Nitratireductor sp. GCM10026969 TaxID=3252645 RepID=UPI003617760B
MTADRTILVTGSTDGLGRRVAEKLAGPGIHILVHGRDASRGEAVVNSIAQAGGSARFFQADFASLADVLRLVEAVQSECARLDVLINNAGISKPNGSRQESTDGYELHFAINYLATFLLTERLLPLLEADGGEAPSRIVNVASAGQSSINFDDVMLERSYHGYRAYGQSKVAQIMYTLDLAEALDAHKIVANALHPGTHMNTTMVREAGITPSTPVDAGAEAVVTLAVRKDRAKTTGLYFDGRRESRATSQVYNPEARRRLRALSVELTGR